MQAHDQTGGYQQAFRASAGLAIWTVAWTASLALARFGPVHLWDSQPAASWAAVAANLAVGIGWIVAHARYLRGIDELQRKIMQEALAVTLGVGWVGGFAYVVADAADLVADTTQHRGLPSPAGSRLHDRHRRRPPQVPVKNRLKDLRTARNWTQADLAQHVSVSRQTINAIEKGKFDPSLPLAFRLARLFDLRIEDVFLDEP